MKKTIISLLALLSVGAGISFAQEEADKTKSAKDRLAEIENKTVDVKKHKSASSENDIFEINGIAHVGYGWCKADGQDFKGKFGPSYEVFVNAFELSLNPVPFISLSAGLDLKWNRFVSTTSQFTVAGGKFATSATTPDNIKSRLCGTSLSVPATLSVNLGDTHLKFGAEASYGLSAYNKAKSSYTNAGSDFTQSTKGGEFEKLVLSYIASVDFDGLGIYYKYCPKPLIPGSDIIKGYQTIGIILSM